MKRIDVLCELPFAGFLIFVGLTILAGSGIYAMTAMSFAGRCIGYAGCICGFVLVFLPFLVLSWKLHRNP
ncbi:MAG: hypothetical protein WC518_02280 [Patescibacteria group bacterium]